MSTVDASVELCGIMLVFLTEPPTVYDQIRFPAGFLLRMPQLEFSGTEQFFLQGIATGRGKNSWSMEARRTAISCTIT